MRILHVTTLVVCLAGSSGHAQRRPPATPAAVAEQAARLSGPDAAARALAACHLGEMGLDALPALPALTQLLADAAPVICGRDTLPSFTTVPPGTTTPGYQAARALVLLGNDGHEALIRAASSAQPEIRRHAVRGLLRVRDRRVADLLLAALNDADPDVRADAARGLGRNRGWW